MNIEKRINKIEKHVVQLQKKEKCSKCKNFIPSDKIKEDNRGRKNRRPVVQCCLSGTFIAEYESVLSASRKTGINRVLISNCCNNKINKAGNYIWKFKK